MIFVGVGFTCGIYGKSLGKVPIKVGLMTQLYHIMRYPVLHK